MSGFWPTHVVSFKHDDLRYPAEGTRVHVSESGETLAWREKGETKSHMLSPFFKKNHLRKLTSAEMAAVFYVHG